MNDTQINGTEISRRDKRVRSGEIETGVRGEVNTEISV